MEPPEDKEEIQAYEQWARSEEKFWGKMRRRDGFWLLAMVLLFIFWRLFDYPRHSVPFQ